VSVTGKENKRKLNEHTKSKYVDNTNPATTEVITADAMEFAVIAFS
jgi:hypothetical protein